MPSTLRMRTTMCRNKDETAVHGCDCRADMVVRMRKVLAITHSRPQSPSFLGHVVGKRGARLVGYK